MLNKRLIKIYEAIGNNELVKALDLLNQATRDDGTRQEIVLLKRNLKEVASHERLGLEAAEGIRREKNRITVAIMGLMETVEHEQAEEEASSDEDALIEEVLSKLSVSEHAYLAQCKIRNLLMEKLKARFRIKGVQNYYQVFSEYYPEMNKQELRYHKIIRGYTENIIKENHFATLEILQSRPSLKKRVPRLVELESHLIIWKSKYESIFEGDESISLVYIGVEEGVKFPSGIDHDLRKCLTREG